MRQIGSTIAALFRSPSDQSIVEKARALVAELCARFPLYPEL
jgi:glycine hydroxymethyltransferase